VIILGAVPQVSQLVGAPLERPASTPDPDGGLPASERDGALVV
jgi:hypothetical protein